MMKTYRVVWEIEVRAETPRDAVREAREIQLDKDSSATAFTAIQLSSGAEFFIELED